MDSRRTEPCRVGLTSWVTPSECELTETITKQHKLGIMSLMLNPCAPKRLCRRNGEVVYMCTCVCVCMFVRMCRHVSVNACVCICVCVHWGGSGRTGWIRQADREGSTCWRGRLKSLPRLCCSFPSWGLGFGTAPSHLPPLCDTSPSATVMWSYPKLFLKAPSERHSCIHRGHTQHKGLTKTQHIFNVHIDSKIG